MSILILFVALHVFSLSRPYQQDEYKWVLYSHPEIIPPGTITHPPLTEFIYTTLGPIVGDTHFRYIPFGFGILNFFLLFYLVRYLYNEKTAQITTLVFTLSFFSLLASLMVDIDGAIMPFFFLILCIGYFKWRNHNFSLDRVNLKWILVLLVGAVGGFMLKMSALLPIFAFAFDFALEKKVFSDKKILAKYLVGVVLGALALVLILIGSKFIFPFFKLETALTYWEHFANSSSFFDRGWFQTAIQCIKAILYSSPFLILTPFLLKKQDVLKLRPFILFLAFAFIFYVILFDFSIGALDRYWQLLVVPLSIFAGVVVSHILDLQDNKTKKFVLLGVLVAIVLILLQFLPHYTPSLHPKSEWITRIFHLKWNFVYPFSGGSGPLGFYVSFMLMASIWILSFLAVGIALFKSKYKKLALMFILPLGIAYNGVFIEEYLFGYINGSAPSLLKEAVQFIKDDPSIKFVTVYNDNGGFDIQSIGKYRKRLYIDPKFDINIKIDTLNTYKEHYFVLNIPKLESGTPFQKYFESCKIVYDKADKKISAKIYDCTKAPDIKIQK